METYQIVNYKLENLNKYKELHSEFMNNLHLSLNKHFILSHNKVYFLMSLLITVLHLKIKKDDYIKKLLVRINLQEDISYKNIPSNLINQVLRVNFKDKNDIVRAINDVIVCNIFSPIIPIYSIINAYLYNVKNKNIDMNTNLNNLVFGIKYILNYYNDRYNNEVKELKTQSSVEIAINSLNKEIISNRPLISMFYAIKKYVNNNTSKNIIVNATLYDVIGIFNYISDKGTNVIYIDIDDKILINEPIFKQYIAYNNLHIDDDTIELMKTLLVKLSSKKLTFVNKINKAQFIKVKPKN